MKELTDKLNEYLQKVLQEAYDQAKKEFIENAENTDYKREWYEDGEEMLDCIDADGDRENTIYDQ